MSALKFLVLIILAFPLVCFGEAFKHYRVMQLERNASPEKISAQYKKLVKEMHPDANMGDKSKESELIEVIEAYKVLSNEGLRAEYDRAQSRGIVDPDEDAGEMTDYYLNRIRRNPFAFEAFRVAFQTFGEYGIEFRDMRMWLQFEKANHAKAYAMMVNLRKTVEAVRRDLVYMRFIDTDTQLDLYKEMIRLRGSQLDHQDYSYLIMPDVFADPHRVAAAKILLNALPPRDIFRSNPMPYILAEYFKNEAQVKSLQEHVLIHGHEAILHMTEILNAQAPAQVKSCERDVALEAAHN